jgi:cytochrome c peroxidase
LAAKNQLPTRNKSNPLLFNPKTDPMKKQSFLFSLLIAVGIYFTASCTDSNKPEVDNKYNPELLSDADKALVKMANDNFGVLPDSIDNPKNLNSPSKIALGKALYFDTRLSKSGVISCNSCHNLATYGVDNLPTSPGHKWAFGDRNSPTSLNAAFHFVQFWDGRAENLEAQAKGPILNPVEMATPHEAFALKRLASIPQYREWFSKAFPTDSNAITYDNVANAIASFERTLLTPSRFDEFMKGNGDAINDQEKKGLQTFINTGCNTCHMGPAVGGNMYQKFGVTKPYWELTHSKSKDEGRKLISKNDGEQYYFKVPSLRNIDKTYPYFHDGSVWNLKEAITIMADLQLGKKLTESDVNDIEAFLKSMTGEVPEQARLLPILPSSTDETEKPIFN